MIISAIFLIIFNIENCSTDSSFLNRIKRIIGREVKDKSLKGTFKTVIYLGSKAKISCYGKKSPMHGFRDFSWYHGDKYISKNKRYVVDNYGVLAIQEVSVEDSGDFTCVANSERGVHKYRHDITVLQLPSKSLHIHFIYAVRLCTEESMEFAQRFIEYKLRGKVCSQEKCELSYIHSNCQFQEFANPTLKVTVPIMLPSMPSGSCNVKCSREKLEQVKEEVKRKVISAVMTGQRLKIREEPHDMSISYLQTDEDNICKPGFEMKGPHSRSVCVPCAPGQFLEKGYCIPCHLNQYNAKYAASECQNCFGHRITRSRGSLSEGDCYVSDPGVLWILFLILIIAALFILVCFSWSFVKLLGESLAKFSHTLFSFISCKSFTQSNSRNPAEGKRRRRSELFKSKEPSKGLDVVNPKPSGNVSPAIPSARHSTAKDYFYNVPQAPPSQIFPPPLPTDSMLKQASRNLGYASGDTKAEGNYDRKDNKNVKNIFPKPSIDPLSHYSERILKNPAMYNAIKKSFA